MKIFELALSEIAIMEFTLIKDSMYTAVYTYIYVVVNNFLMSLRIGIFDRLNSDNQPEIFSILCVQKIRFPNHKNIIFKSKHTKWVGFSKTMHIFEMGEMSKK